MKRRLGFLCAVMFFLFAVGLVLPVGSDAADPQYVIRYASIMPVNHHITQSQYNFAKLINEKSGGRVKVEVFPSGQLFSDKDMVKAIPEGALDVGAVTLALFTGLVPAAQVSDLTMFFKDRDHHIRFEDSAGGEILKKEVEKKGVKFINWLWTAEGTVFCTNKPIRKMEDLKGLRIRSHGEVVSEALKAMGAVPVFLGGGEVYMGIQRGTIDGTIGGFSNIVSRKFYEVSKHITIIPGFQFVTYWVLANKNKWESLPPDIQKIILEAGQEAQRWDRNEEIQDAITGEEFLKSKKITPYTLPEQEVEKIRQAVRPAVMNYFLKDTGDIGKRLISEADKVRK
jgi:tripartite ATP-independent transporter DctP family solute receptor